MTRGKNAVAATGRRANDALESEISTYQRRVRDLTAEVKALREEIATTRAHFADERRLLIAQRTEGIAPELEASKRENDRLRNRAECAERTTKKIDDLWQKVMKRLIDHFKTDHGYTGTEAIEKLMNWTGDKEGVLIWDDDKFIEKHGAEAARTLQRLRRDRRHT